MRQRPGLTPEQRAMALRLRAKGFEFKEIGEQIDVSKSSAHNAVIGLTIRTAKPLSWTPGPGRLVLEEREEISLGLHRGASLTSIAAGLGRSLSTVSREVAANGGRVTIEPGGPTGELRSGRGGPRRSSWPHPSWPPRSAGG